MDANNRGFPDSLITRRICLGTGLFALAGGAVTLLGWVLDVPRLTDWINQGISMLPNPAVAAMAAGLGVLCLVLGYNGCVRWLGVAVALIGGATLFEHLTEVSLGIDTVILTRGWGQRATTTPGRMGPPASVSFTLLGIGLILATTRPGGRLRAAVPMLALFVVGIAFLSFAGYLFDADPLFAVPRLTGIALQASLIVMALGFGLTAAIPECQPMRTLVEDSAAGKLTRRALPFVIGLPLLVGWLRLRAQQDLGLIDTAMGVALLVLTLVVMMLVVLWWGAAVVAAHEAHRKDVEADLQELNATLERRITERTAVAEERATQLGMLASELTRAEERERRRIAQVLHDGLQQILVAAKFRLDDLASNAERAPSEKIKKICGLVDEGLTLSRNLSLELSPPLLHDAGLAAALEWLARRYEEQHGLAVHVDADPAADPPDLARREFLFRSAGELLFNVTKHARTDEAWLKLSAPGGREVVVEVRDGGVGCDLAHSDGPRGEQFGLFSIRERLRLLGGEMKVCGGRDQGLHIALHLPLPNATDAEPEAPPGPWLIEGADAPAPVAGIRLLIADDHAVVREGIVLVLQNCADVEIVGQAGDGVEATEAALRLRPDVVVMDVSMPRLNGVEATRRIKAALPHVQIIGLSMHESRDMAKAMLAAGASAFFSKTEAPDKLLAAIRSARGFAT